MEEMGKGKESSGLWVNGGVRKSGMGLLGLVNVLFFVDKMIREE